MKRVYLEITNACNLDCPFCSYTKAGEYMDIEDIDDCLIQIKQFCNYIYLHILGEPLLHPEFNRILDLLDEYGMYLQLVTNGTLLDKYPDILDHACLRKLSISVHSVKDVDVSDSYFETINRLIESETDKAIELRFYDRNRLDDKLNAYLDELYGRYEIKETSRDGSYKLNDHTYIYFQELFRWPHIEDETISEYGYCHGGTDMIAINVKKDVTLCCLDPLAHNAIGNLEKSSLKQILNSELYNSYLENIRNKRLIFPLCQKCSYRSRFDLKNSLQDDR